MSRTHVHAITFLPVFVWRVTNVHVPGRVTLALPDVIRECTAVSFSLPFFHFLWFRLRRLEESCHDPER